MRYSLRFQCFYNLTHCCSCCVNVVTNNDIFSEWRGMRIYRKTSSYIFLPVFFLSTFCLRLRDSRTHKRFCAYCGKRHIVFLKSFFKLFHDKKRLIESAFSLLLFMKRNGDDVIIGKINCVEGENALKIFKKNIRKKLSNAFISLIFEGMHKNSDVFLFVRSCRGEEIARMPARFFSRGNASSALRTEKR